jgi:hypothetical protein
MKNVTRGRIAVSFVALLIFACFASTGYSAQQVGDSSLQFSGGFQYYHSSEEGNLNVSIEYGKYTSRPLEVGVLQSFIYNFVEERSDSWSALTAGYANWHFLGFAQNDTFQPFLGGFAGIVYNDEDLTGAIGPNVGFKAYVNDRMFVATRYRYEMYLNDLELGGDPGSAWGNHVITVGLGFLW